MKKLLTGVLAAVLVASNGLSLQKADLSPEAQALIPDSKMVSLTMKDGKKIEGTVVIDKPSELVLRIQRGGTLGPINRTIQKDDIKLPIETMDVTPSFAAKMKEYKLDPEGSMPEKDYALPLKLMDEFLAKCKDSPDAGAVKTIRDSYAAELQQVQTGMKRVKDQWLTPVLGILKEFNDCTEQIKALKANPKLNSEPKLQQDLKGFEDRRKAAVRDLPKMMQDRIPTLLKDKKFDDAATDAVSFLQFWLVQVMSKEGLGESFQNMDFDYVIRFQNRVMEAYRQAGMGNDKGPATVEKDMVYIPGGYFIMGRAEAKPGDPDFPMHLVFVSPFLIDKYEVNNKDYRKFVDTVKSTGLASMEHPDAPPMKKHDAQGWAAPGLSRDNQPVIGVDWFDAYAYTKWVGKRLPTEAEWERAARGADGRQFTWGDKAPDAVAVNWALGRSFVAQEMDRMNPPKPQEVESGGCSCVKPPPAPPQATSLPAETWDVNSGLPKEAREAVKAGLIEWKTPDCVSPYGVYHMAGNAAEWVSDFFDPQYYGKSPLKDPQGPEKGEKGHVFRGGSFLSDNKQDLTAYNRGIGQNAPGGTIGGKACIGFRGVKELGVFKKD